MPYWIMKSEPDVFSIADLRRRQEACWDGVRNYQARNFLRAMRPGDLFFFHHSSCAVPGIAGIGRISSEAFPDPTADAGQPQRWSAVNVSFVCAFEETLPLSLLKAQPTLQQMLLLRKGNRLSVMPVSDDEWRAVLALAPTAPRGC